MITIDEIYNLKTGGTHWSNWTDPGPHRGTGGTSTAQQDNYLTYDAHKKVFDSEANVRSTLPYLDNTAAAQPLSGQESTSHTNAPKPSLLAYEIFMVVRRQLRSRPTKLYGAKIGTDALSSPSLPNLRTPKNRWQTKPSLPFKAQDSTRLQSWNDKGAGCQ